MQSTSRSSLALGACAIACLAATSGAQTFTEDFDSYSVGPLEGNTNASGATWHGWAGTNTLISQVSTGQASSAPHSVLLPFGTDTVVDFDEMTAGNPMMDGQWRMTAEIFVTGNYDGNMIYMIMNEYTDPGPYEWAVQVDMNGSTGNMTCQCGTAGVISVPLVVDQWVDLRWDIDLDADNVDFYYDGTLLASYTWSGGVFGSGTYATLSVDAIDLYPGVQETVGEAYVDNIQILDIGVPDEPGVAYCPGDGVAPHTMCPCINNNNGSMGGCDWGNASFPEGGVLSATGSASIVANDAVLVANGVDNDFGIFFGANNQVNSGNGNPLNDGLRCAGGALVRLIPPTLAAGNMATLPMPIASLDTGAAAGVTRRYQYWFRTPTGPCGQTANLTNGYEIVWLP